MCELAGRGRFHRQEEELDESQDAGRRAGKKKGFDTEEREEAGRTERAASVGGESPKERVTAKKKRFCGR